MEVKAKKDEENKKVKLECKISDTGMGLAEADLNAVFGAYDTYDSRQNSNLIKCKAIERIGSEQRQQLWNYMRLTRIRIGILYNFAPAHDQCERYFLDVKKDNMYAF